LEATKVNITISCGFSFITTTMHNYSHKQRNPYLLSCYRNSVTELVSSRSCTAAAKKAATTKATTTSCRTVYTRHNNKQPDLDLLRPRALWSTAAAAAAAARRLSSARTTSSGPRHGLRGVVLGTRVYGSSNHNDDDRPRSHGACELVHSERWENNMQHGEHNDGVVQRKWEGRAKL
jgi:putative N-acetylmannosamine-6-phosphate epimerase